MKMISFRKLGKVFQISKHILIESYNHRYFNRWLNLIFFQTLFADSYVLYILTEGSIRIEEFSFVVRNKLIMTTAKNKRIVTEQKIFALSGHWN